MHLVECKTNEPNLMRTDMRYYTLPIILLIISTMFSRAIALDPTKATVLPSMDWVCFASFTIAFSALPGATSGLGVDGDNLKKPRIQLKTIEGRTLKIIENPTDTARRKEYGHDVSEISQDFSRSNPVFAWNESTDAELRIYGFNLDHRTLSITRISHSRRLNLSSAQVLNCK